MGGVKVFVTFDAKRSGTNDGRRITIASAQGRQVRAAVVLALCLGVMAACIPPESGLQAQRPEAVDTASSVAVSEPVEAPERQKVVVYVPYWDQARGFATAVANAGVVTDVSPWWYSVWPDGSAAPQWQGADYVDLATVRQLQALGARVVPTVANHRDGEWESGPVQQVLRDPAVQDVHVRSIVALVTENGFDGIDLDYENLRAADRDRLTSLVQRLVGELRPLGKVVTVDVHPKTDDAGDDPRNEAQDFAALGAAADELRLMAYDFHNDESEPGPIAPADWVRDVLGYMLSVVPAERVVVGVPLFGYDWKGEQADGLTWEEVTAIETANAASVEGIAHEDESAFRYQVEGDTREVWFYDADNILARVDLAREHGVGGVFFWRLGGEDPALWQRLR